ncbi:hypothetical protein PR202_ga21379 [Eleusine coracana subsp. coracana]|uniref:Caffeoyl-CoA O-methyltransferase n=1 Tax=Eleusine coracana subsp. coracana TaxID=191504 RepID=A0AAV5D0H3_ELECO|nr:hypothetical protein PR202_ga21379 [Eleusine coracana subsp. coracana]
MHATTIEHCRGFMGSSPDQMQFFSMLLKMIGAKRTLEVGVFTGYSLLATALALPDDGKVVAIDASREHYELGRPVIEKAGVGHKVDFRASDGIAELDRLLAEGGEELFDLAYVDADKQRSEFDRVVRDFMVGFNAAVAADDRVQACLLPIADGVTLCRRVK